MNLERMNRLAVPLGETPRVPPGIDELAAIERRRWEALGQQARREGPTADNTGYTPGTGATIAADDIGGVLYQRTKISQGADGSATDVSESKPLFTSQVARGPIYAYNIPSQVHVAVANTVHWDMFNADAALIVRVLSIRQIPNVTTAVTGVVFDWKLSRSTSVGTGGVSQAAWLADTNDTALDVDITARSKPTGGAAEGTILFNYSISSEETTAATIDLASKGGLELVPPSLLMSKGIVLRQNQGLRVTQITNSSAGNTGWLIAFSVE